MPRGRKPFGGGGSKNLKVNWSGAGLPKLTRIGMKAPRKSVPPLPAAMAGPRRAVSAEELQRFQKQAYAIGMQQALTGQFVQPNLPSRDPSVWMAYEQGMVDVQKQLFKQLVAKSSNRMMM